SGMQNYASVAARGELDEDAAESRADDDEIAKIIASTPPKPQIGTQLRASLQPYASTSQEKPQTNLAMISSPAQVKFPAVKPAGDVPNVTPTPRDNAAPVSTAAYPFQSLPQVIPQPRSSATLTADIAPTTLKVTTAPGTTTAKLAN